MLYRPEKAFDKIKREGIWDFLQMQIVDKHLIEMIKALQGKKFTM